MEETVQNLSKGQKRRETLIEAAAELIRETGPATVTHRAVAARAGCSLSATTYYFSGLDDLLTEAGRINIKRWAERAEMVADEMERDGVPSILTEATDTILRACLPPDISLTNHYMQLMAASSAEPIAVSYQAGRRRLDNALARVLNSLDCRTPPELVIAVVDGAAVSAISEKRDIRETAHVLLTLLLREAWQRVV